MRQIKKGFDLIDYDISKYAAVLVFPVRLAIIRVLINDGDWVPVTALAHLSLDEQFVRQHLEELQKVGLVELLKKDEIIQARINKKSFSNMSAGFIDLLNKADK